MLRHQELRILQHNVSKPKDVALASLFQNSNVLEYDVLAIQEPWRNPFMATSYHPLKTYFHLAYLADDMTRVCLYINKRIDSSTWTILFIAPDIICMKISDPQSSKRVHIFNVY